MIVVRLVGFFMFCVFMNGFEDVWSIFIENLIMCELIYLSRIVYLLVLCYI